MYPGTQISDRSIRCSHTMWCKPCQITAFCQVFEPIKFRRVDLINQQKSKMIFCEILILILGIGRFSQSVWPESHE